MNQKKSLLLALFACVFVFSGFSETVIADNWTLSWEFVGSEIEFTLKAPTTGWVSIGFNPSRMMKDAEYVLAYVKDGETVVRQDFGTGMFSHKAVTELGWKQNLRVISGSEEGGNTSIVFTLPLTWGEAYGTKFEKGKTYKILLAYGPSNADNFTSKHRKKESITLTL
ncbi:DOMON domain protein [Sphaerochaeta pleomorpha str. Grapes]|uniref:DOMON domain protein n=1 Tax=Sphaerochaeta pleomorpha (strain ATCC BAA-1885 / DSM 22778 / Grapes) TaxID=158190 RepID=G8QT28_SPHPG|nr:DOMON domain-containing protein [Sphaerochaeta pleomorpha]AEV27933.1 DOMON domain protein [Sphaerochaeta pleomorpha str. Grapes]